MGTSIGAESGVQHGQGVADSKAVELQSTYSKYRCLSTGSAEVRQPHALLPNLALEVHSELQKLKV